MVQPRNPRSHPMEKTVQHGGEPFTGPYTCDATPARAFLLDLPAGAMRGLHRPKHGIEEVLKELADAMPAHGNQAGVPADAYQTVLDRSAKLVILGPIRTAVAKLHQVCEETAITLEDGREKAISRITDAVTSTAKRNKDAAIKAPFEKTLAYTSQVARKAVATKEANLRKNAAASKPK